MNQSQLNNNAVNANNAILVVEDDKFLRELMIKKLKKEGFGILSASEAKEGLKIAGEKKPQLILLDLILPGMDGFAMLDQLKKDPQTSNIPVIVLSNVGQAEGMDRAKSGGAMDYMVKSDSTPGEIVEKIRAVLGRVYF